MVNYWADWAHLLCDGTGTRRQGQQNGASAAEQFDHAATYACPNVMVYSDSQQGLSVFACVPACVRAHAE